MEHPVWEILIKDRWTEEGIVAIEKLYDATERIFKDATPEDIETFFNGFNDHMLTTFSIVKTMRK